MKCPHCGIGIEILEKNCCIFRCGVYKHNNVQINPHLDKQSCDNLVSKGLIHGCGKPFKLVGNRLEICDYI